MIFKTNFNLKEVWVNAETGELVKFKPIEGEKNFPPTKTVPNQTLTIKEVIERYRRGIPLPQISTPLYTGELPVPNFAAMDLSERTEYIEELTRRNKELQDDLRIKEAELDKKKKKRDRDKRIEEYKQFMAEQGQEPSAKPPLPEGKEVL